MEKPAATKVQAGCKPLTTFVQTDTNSFREVVQRLTGPTEPNNTSQKESAGPSNNKPAGLKKPKLHERRQYMRPKLEIAKPNIHVRPTDQISPSKLGPNSGLNHHHTSPLGTPCTIMSSLSIKEENNNNNGKKEVLESVLNSEEEEKAINERRFYLHPSPRGRVGYTEPELLTLFPLQSPQNK